MKSNVKYVMSFCFTMIMIWFAFCFPAAAIEEEKEEDGGGSSIDLARMSERIENGQLEVPEDFRERLALYQCVAQAVDEYAETNHIDDVFSCNLWESLLYGSRGFSVLPGLSEDESREYPFGNKSYEYPFGNIDKAGFMRDSYQLKLEGEEHVLYAEINVPEEKVFLYPEEEGRLNFDDGNPEAYKKLRRIKTEEGQLIEYDVGYYVENDWPDMEQEDDHFGEVSLEELEQLDFLRLPEGVSEQVGANLYLSVASALKRYIEENRIEEVFYFDAKEDIVSSVTNMIFTCRVRSRSMTLYIDLDGANMRCHVYRVEE